MKQSHIDRLITGILITVATAVVTALVLAWLADGLTANIGVAALAIGVLSGAWAAYYSPGPTKQAFSLADIILLSVFTMASLRAFLWLIYTVGDEVRVLSPHNLGDISIHIQMIRYFAAGATFWPESPILAGAPLVYPAGINVWNSLLVVTGILPVERGLIAVGLIGAMLTAWKLWRWGGGFALAMVLFNGGLAGWTFFTRFTIDDYQFSLAWKNIFLTMLVTQRGLLYAMPCALTLLRAWRDESNGLPPGISPYMQWFLYATLPLFHVHAFIFLSLILAAAFCFVPDQRRRLVQFVACAVPPATLAIFLVTGFFSVQSGFRWNPGWMQVEFGPWFWLRDFGFSLLLPPLLVWKGIWKGTATTRIFVSTALTVWLVCMFFAIAPWAWDNTKLMLWGWLALAPFIWQHILRPWPPLWRNTACFALFFSGALALYGGLDRRHGYTLIQRSELAKAQSILQQIPPSDRIAISPQYNHPAILLGRPVVCGYEGHLWSHGLDYWPIMQMLPNMLMLGEGWEKDARTVGADWIWSHAPDSIPIPVK
jgi:hypothetical protein